MIDFTLTDEQEQIRRSARDFAEREIRPRVERLDRDPAGATDNWEVLRPMYEQAAALGYTGFFIPEEYGGSGRRGVDGAIFVEEIAAVDLGVANTLGATMGYPLFILFAGTEEQKRAWLPPLCSGQLHLLAGAQSEPDVAGSEMFCPYPDPKLGLRTRARRDGDGYVISGGKSAFITNAGVASAYFLVCRTALDRPLSESLSLFYVPADLPGIRVGPRTHLLGMRSGFHAPLYLDDVRVPAECLLGGEGNALAILSAVLGQGIGAQFVGLARAAYQHALDYARQRRSWGRPLIEHQAVAMMLADMEIEIQAARLLTWDALCAAERMDPQARIKGMASKTFAVDVAIKTAQNAVKILGAYGVTREYRAAKYLCDAIVGYACDFTGDMLRILIAAELQQRG
jgi:alkylation response protein AidB-like acyl-CoA dehydrogenase